MNGWFYLRSWKETVRDPNIEGTLDLVSVSKNLHICVPDKLSVTVLSLAFPVSSRESYTMLYVA